MECLKKKLSEGNDELIVDAQPDANGKVTTQGLERQLQAAERNVTGGASVALKVDSKDLYESEDSAHITKRQIKEAKIKKLQENSVRFTKKDLK